MELEIKVMWCKGLTAFNFFQKMAVYAAVSITPLDRTLKLTQDEKQEQKTPVDQEGDGNPEWNYTMKFDLRPPNISSNLHQLSLLFEIRNQGQLFGYKEIGEVRVHLKDLIESVGIGISRLVSYEVRASDGKHNGILDFSYKVINTVDFGNCVPDSHIQISGYGHHHHHHHHQESHHHSSHTSESGGIQYTNNGYLGHSLSDTHLAIPGYGHHSHQGSHHFGTSLSYVSERIQYPKIYSDMGTNQRVPSSWDPRHQPPNWGPPPRQAHYSPPPPPPPRILPPPPPPHQQPYAYQPPPSGDPYWAYHGSPPNHQQPTGSGYNYRHW